MRGIASRSRAHSQVKWHRAGRPFGAHQRRCVRRIAEWNALPLTPLPRSLRFPESCDMSKVDAKLCNGSAWPCNAAARALR